MHKFCLFCLLCFSISCCNTKDTINKKMIDSIYEINIQNRAAHRFGGIEEINIKDQKEITSFCKELTSLKEENNLQTRPFKGTILIRFLKKDRDGMGEYVNVLTTSVVFKLDDKYFIDNSTGQYVSDHFLARILKYLEIDESKVSALDEYRKSKKENNNK